jgi:ATP-dependent exoDNAse (exonuclease V) beta subunit
VDPVTEQLRPVQGGDVAVLCRQRSSCRALADALATAGLQVALKLPGVMDTPEGLLAAAGLRLMLDPSDTLAAGTIAFFNRDATVSADAWLEARLRETGDGNGDDHGRTAFAHDPIVSDIRSQRHDIRNASPREALDAVLSVLDLPRWCRALPQSAQALANVEALRGLADQYEERCRVLRRPATPAGLLAELYRLNKEGQDEAAEGHGPDAVRVLTYHAAKGLEWPVVILSELDYEGPTAWTGVHVESTTPFDLSNPLANRTLRYWFSPFDQQQTVEYLENLEKSEAAQALERRAAEERLRLLYVGATRARDHLAVAVRVSKHGAYQQSWLELIPDLVLPPVMEDCVIDVAGIPTRAWRLGPSAPEPRPRPEPRWLTRHEGELTPRRPARVQPSALEATAPSDTPSPFQVGEVIRLGDPLHTGPVDARDVLGTAVHAFLAADPGPSAPQTDREVLATRVLANWGQTGVLPAGHLLSASDRLQAFLAIRYPNALHHREWPLACRQDGQELWGQADLVLETPEGFVLIDYKTFQGPPAIAAHRFGHQLQAYLEAIRLSTGQTTLPPLVYLALQGLMVKLSPSAHSS